MKMSYLFQYCSSSLRRKKSRGGIYACYHLALIICLYLFSLGIAAQPPAKYQLFNRTLSQVEIRLPQPATFQPVNISANGNSSYQLMLPLNSNQLDVSVREQNRRLMQQYEATTRHGQGEIPDDIKADIVEFNLGSEYKKWMEQSTFYRNAYSELSQLDPDNFSISKAVFLVENAFQNNKYSYAELQARLQLEAKIIRQQLKAEKLDVQDNIALNYCIQKRFRIGGQYYDSKKKATVAIRPFKYDFRDYLGKADYRQTFVTKMFITGRGQCHSMPLAYLMIAEQLGAKVWLSLAPEHSFIRFKDTKGNLLNFETTSAALVSNNWLQQSGYINAPALKNRIYLDTLSQRELYAQCLADLLQGYLKKFNYDDFAETMQQRILQLNPRNMTALMIEADLCQRIAIEAIRAAGSPKPLDLPKHPQAYYAYLSMQAAFEKVDGMGYQEMPPKAYQKWLKSVEQEKKKQENRELQQRLQREMEYLKKIKPKFIISNKID